jgi:phosphatidylglycerol:prolipoprotein diacylglycerol transferase
MKPTLLALRLGEVDIRVPSYGLAVAVGIAVAILLAARQAPRYRLDQGQVLDLSFWLLVAGLGGSRLLYVLLNAPDFARLCAGSGEGRPAMAALKDCLAPLRLWDGGLVFYGGALAASVVAWRFGRRRGWRFAVLGDMYAPGLALGHAIGRLGCFGAGCCFGKTGGGPLGVAFPAGSVAHDHLTALGVIGPSTALTPPLHPTQIYESAALIALAFVLLAIGKNKRFHGQVILAYVAGYAGLRFLLELFRGDLGRRFLFQLRAPALSEALGLPAADPVLLSTSQLVSLALLAAALVMWRRQRPLPSPLPSPRGRGEGEQSAR